MHSAAQPSAGGVLAGWRFAFAPVVLAAACLFAAGCAINPRVELAEVTAEADPVLLQDVPFYPQTEHQCGPAALAGVLGQSGANITPEQLAPQVFLPERKGSLQVELQAATRRAGRIPYVLDSRLDAVLDEVRSGRPVLVLQNLGTRTFPRWHYAVLVGFDPAGNAIYLNSGKRERMEEGAPTFMRTWEWGGRWAMIALEPGQLPHSPGSLRYYQAVAAFEALNGAEALAAWQAAARQWPEDYRPLFALGNMAYSSGDFENAVRHYQRALQLSPGEAAVENNLAEALAALGCPRAAEQRLAASLEQLPEESPWRKNLEATLGEMVDAENTGDPGKCSQWAAR